MRNTILTAFCALSLVCSASPAIAGTYGEDADPIESPSSPPPRREVVETVDETSEYAELGPFFGFGGVYAIELFDNGQNIDNSNGFHVRAGYRVHEHVAVEVRYEHYLNFETDPGFGHFEGWGIYGNVKGFILTGRWQPYLLMGMGYMDLNYPGNNRVNDPSPGDDFAMRFGAGFDAHLSDLVSIGPEVAYVLPFGDIDDLDMVTVGIGLQFNF